MSLKKCNFRYCHKSAQRNAYFCDNHHELSFGPSTTFQVGVSGPRMAKGPKKFDKNGVMHLTTVKVGETIEEALSREGLGWVLYKGQDNLKGNDTKKLTLDDWAVFDLSEQGLNPEHYRKGKIEPWDFIVDQGLNYLAGNVVKYISRYKHKNGVEDLKKAKTYLEKLIIIEKGNL